MAGYPGSYSPNQQRYGPPPAQGNVPPGYGGAVQPPPYYYGYQPYAPPRSSGGNSLFPLIGGVMLLISAISEVAMGAIFMLFGGMVSGMVGDAFGISSIIMVCGSIEIVTGIIGIIGAVFAFMKKYWGLCLLAAVLCMVGVGFYFTGTIFGIVALVFLLISKDSFQ